VTWIIAGDDLAALRTTNAGLARRFFDNPRTYVIGTRQAPNQVPPGYQAQPTLAYASAAALLRDLNAGRIVGTVHAILYDPEYWSKTPASEQRDPNAAMARVAAAAKRERLVAMIAPGRDLGLSPVSSCRKRVGELLDQTYLRCGMPAAAARAPLVIVQTAPDQLSLPALRGFLRAVTGELQTTHPQLVATLSSRPNTAKRPVWPATLVAATRAELGYASGLMLNFTPDKADLLASYLRDLERLGRVAGYNIPGSGRSG
jgi:hypothetical protein